MTLAIDLLEAVEIEQLPVMDFPQPATCNHFPSKFSLLALFSNGKQIGRTKLPNVAERFNRSNAMSSRGDDEFGW